MLCSYAYSSDTYIAHCVGERYAYSSLCRRVIRIQLTAHTAHCVGERYAKSSLRIQLRYELYELYAEGRVNPGKYEQGW